MCSMGLSMPGVSEKDAGFPAKVHVLFSILREKQDKKKMFPARYMVIFVQYREEKDRILPKQGQKERKIQETRGNMFAQA